MTATTDTIHVLHVDDDSASADRAARFLERADDRITARTATSATEGLEMLAGRCDAGGDRPWGTRGG